MTFPLPHPLSATPRVSVLMPTFKQAQFLRRAIESLYAQTLHDWELIVVNDGSPDETEDLLTPYRPDPRVQYVRFPRNRGLGAALNFAVRQARGRYLAYLPSDDVYYPEHLAKLADFLDRHPETYLAYGGVRWAYGKYGPTLRGEEAVGREQAALTIPPDARRGERLPSGNLLAPVQVMHRRDLEGEVYWAERSEVVSDSLEADFWRALLARGVSFSHAPGISCEWVDHPEQRHKLIGHHLNGLYRYRQHYGVDGGEYLNFRPSPNSRAIRVDERARYARFTWARDLPSPDGLKILLVGSLGFNPERMIALEERGHKLYGLWNPAPETWQATGPFPFGNITDIPLDDRWQERVRAVKPDVIYALLNWQDMRLISRVQQADLGIPFVFHFKEGPFICQEHGLWNELLHAVEHSDGRIFGSPENRAWFELALHRRLDSQTCFVLDGDLASRTWMSGDWVPKLSHQDGQIHTVCAGRPLGLVPWSDLAAAGIHVHFYGEHFGDWFPNWSREGQESGFLHLHSTVEPADWVRELSRYDAGWLQLFDSYNEGDLRKAHWDDLNLPARMGTYAVAGLPLIMKDNRSSTVAMQTLAQEHDIGLFFRTFADLGDQLRDRVRLDQLTENARAARPHFAFDTHADGLIEFLRSVIAQHGQRTTLQERRTDPGSRSSLT
ncbi:glycosyltransferase family 2 protein [Deinococcus oregonensis]|uniref:Glycosyltransferase family 2 protein n=1 Tax=Deinococcus oregonensis TaxID=1805970 RepID=A0ABV6AXM7_9DEIO